MEITSQKRDLPERITNRERKRLRKVSELFPFLL